MLRKLGVLNKRYFCTLLLILAGCSSSKTEESHPKQGVSKNVVELLGGQDVVDVINNAEVVSGYLLPQKSYHQESVEDYTMRLGPIELPEVQKSKLTKILLSKESYLYDIAKGCAPDYGVRIEFQKGENRVDLLFCFGCSQVQAYKNGKSLSGGEFDPVEKQLAEIMKEIFPDDEAIQGL